MRVITALAMATLIIGLGNSVSCMARGHAGADASRGTAVPAAPESIPLYDEALLSKPKYSVTMQSNIRIPMRDGITLAADIYRPDAPGRFPVLLERTPYNRASLGKWNKARWYASRGYIFVREDVRGRYDSGGQFYAFRNEANDGYDTDQWIGHQPWFKAGICTIGGSYTGYTQWAQAIAASPYLKCAAPEVTTGNIYGGWIYINGVFHYGFDLPWGGVDMQGHVDQLAWGAFDWDKIYPHLPIATADKAAHHTNQFYRDWIKHPTPDAYWDDFSFEDDYSGIAIPILSTDGWYDIFLHGDLEDDAGVRQHANTALARNNKHMMIGPWAHGVGTRVALHNGRAGGAPAKPIDFGPNAQVDMKKVYLRWFDHWLKGIDNGVGTEASYKIFVMGLNYWRTENEWPLARTQYTNYYIASGGHANTARGDGVLSVTSPHDAAKTDNFRYDPRHPVPSMGGNVCCSTVPSGPWDQRSVERRDDVLVYTTPVFDKPMEITGPLKMVLYAATSAKDTDWTAKLVDVKPDGFAQNIQSGIVRARYRNGVQHGAQPITPGKVYKYTIDMWATSYVILPGHRLRVEISSSDFPRFDRNLNTMERPETGTKTVIAHQTIYHSDQYPSHIVLPVIPQSAHGLPDGTDSR